MEDMQKYRTTIENESVSWPDDYYLETSAEKRKAILEAQLASDDSEDNRIRYQLWEKRYTSPKKGFTGADYFMKTIITMETITDDHSIFFRKKRTEKEIRTIRDTFCLDLLKEKAEYSYIWKEEFLHLWRLYIEACKDDRNYSGLIMGTGKMSEKRLVSKLTNDIYQKSVLLPEKLHLSEELSEFREAAREAVRLYLPAASV